MAIKWGGVIIDMSILTSYTAIISKAEETIRENHNPPDQRIIIDCNAVSFATIIFMYSRGQIKARRILI